MTEDEIRKQMRNRDPADRLAEVEEKIKRLQNRNVTSAVFVIFSMVALPAVWRGETTNLGWPAFVIGTIYAFTLLYQGSILLGYDPDDYRSPRPQKKPLASR